MVVLFIAMPLINRMMLPDEKDSVYIDPSLLNEDETRRVRITRPAERLENSVTLAWLVGIPGLLFLLDHFVLRGGGLNLNVVNFLFLFLAIVLHRTPRSLLESLHEAIKGGAGIVIQFPFYAGIMAIMVQSGLPRRSPAPDLDGFRSLAALLDLHQRRHRQHLRALRRRPMGRAGAGHAAGRRGPGRGHSRVAMAVAWGDAWTNLLQPFWPCRSSASPVSRPRTSWGSAWSSCC